MCCDCDHLIRMTGRPVMMYEADGVSNKFWGGSVVKGCSIGQSHGFAAVSQPSYLIDRSYLLPRSFEWWSSACMIVFGIAHWSGERDAWHSSVIGLHSLRPVSSWHYRVQATAVMWTYTLMNCPECDTLHKDDGVKVEQDWNPDSIAQQLICVHQSHPACRRFSLVGHVMDKELGQLTFGTSSLCFIHAPIKSFYQ